MNFSIFVIALWTVVQWSTAHGTDRVFSSCKEINVRSEGQAVSGVYKIHPLPSADPIEVYCEMAIKGGGYTFLPRGLTRRQDAQQIVDALFNEKNNVLLKLQKKWDRSESYTLIQPHPDFTQYDFTVLVNSYTGYTKPQNADIMRDYIFLGVIPEPNARSLSNQGFISNDHLIAFANCDKNPHSLFAFMPNHDLKTPASLHPDPIFEHSGIAVAWRSTAIPITNPDRMMPNEFFFLTELHFGGCGCYTSSDRWNKYGFHATAIGVH